MRVGLLRSAMIAAQPLVWQLLRHSELGKVLRKPLVIAILHLVSVVIMASHHHGTTFSVSNPAGSGLMVCSHQSTEGSGHRSPWFASYDPLKTLVYILNLFLSFSN